MSKILFVQNYDGELYGVMSIASFVRRRHEVKVTRGPHERILDDCKSFKPDVVGIYVPTVDQNWALDVARQVKSVDKNSIILLGGPHPTFYTDMINDDCVDAICVGEGEKAVLKLLDRIDEKRDYADIPSLWVKRGGRTHKNGIDTLLKPEEIPVPDRSVYASDAGITNSRRVMILCSRGCPFECSFCINKGLKNLYGLGWFRLRRKEDVIAEIVEAKKCRRVDSVSFQDDIFGLDRGWLSGFLEEYKKKVRTPFYCLLRCDIIDEGLVDCLKDAGCFEVGIGVESGDEGVRNGILKKNLSNRYIRNAVRVLREKGVRFHTFNMLGLPSENYELALKTLLFNIELQPDVAYTSLFQPYPGTCYFNEDVRRDVINPGFSRFKINHPYSRDYRRIQRLQKFFMLTLKYPLIRFLLPILTRLPLDGLYDRVSKLSWRYIYFKRITNR